MSIFPSHDPLDPDAFRPHRQDPYLRVLSIHVFVRDQDQSLGFYVDQLGFALIVDAKNYESGGRLVLVAPPDGNTFLALVAPERNSAEYKLIGRCRHAVLVTEDVVAKFDEWRTHGVRFHHPPRIGPGGGVFTRFDDLDGNSFGLVGRDDFVARQQRDAGVAGSIAKRLESGRRLVLEKGEPTEMLTLDQILGTIAQAALLLTSAHGAAVALRRQGEMMCLGRSGTLAPPLGASLIVDWGLAAQCLRTKMVLWSDDTLSDERVDRELCRVLGIRSIALAPLLSVTDTVGILGVFSLHTHAFREKDLGHLKVVAAIAASIAGLPLELVGEDLSPPSAR
jgi:catechol 2,3-dioxygenase-like lactoylglutathione lyase family enzyme